MENEQDTIGNTTKSNYLTELDAQIAREQKYRDAITQIIPMLQAINNTESLAEAGRATMLLNETIANLTALDAIRNDFINETVPVSELITRYSSLRNLHSDSQIEADVEKWTNQFIVIYTAYKTAVDDGLEEISQYRPRLVLYTQTHNGQYANEAREEIDLIDQVYQPALEADKLALEQVAREWSDPNIPRVDVVNHFIDIKNGVIAPPALVTQEDVDKKTRQWDDILNQP